ncbi:MAG TPA: cysteine--tRNA ligase [Clostridiaceae bacterium]|nr:cysteine--tRNA ligase [Clostridiaceae bacterium]
MRIYNTLTRKKEELIPLEPNHIKMYVCGPTVYDFFHLGNARPFVTYDTLRRYLEYKGYQVTYVQNFTDIDDKMIKRANEEGITVKELADRMIEEYFHDADALNIKRATHHPRATDNIDEIIDLVSTLEEKGFAYVTSDGVYFEIDKDPEYGKLSGKRIEDLEAGASDRVTSKEDKKSPLDFSLWKFKKEGEPYWTSPWGEGRPGWHIECSAMSRACLGDTIDLHAGGVDLVFPHHENEIAQSENATGKTFARYWMHNGFINIDKEKMSKSKGNFFLVRELAESYPYQVIRFFMLQAHYRMPINFDKDLLDAAVASWSRMTTCINNLLFVAKTAPEEAATEEAKLAATRLEDAITTAEEEWDRGLSDDLNTADAIAAIFDLVRVANTEACVPGIPRGTLMSAHDKLIELLGVLGLNPAETETAIPADIMAMVERRQEAKKARNYSLADSLRDEIAAAGYKIEDTPQGSKVTPV